MQINIRIEGRKNDWSDEHIQLEMKDSSRFTDHVLIEVDDTVGIHVPKEDLLRALKIMS